MKIRYIKVVVKKSQNKKGTFSGKNGLFLVKLTQQFILEIVGSWARSCFALTPDSSLQLNANHAKKNEP